MERLKVIKIAYKTFCGRNGHYSVIEEAVFRKLYEKEGLTKKLLNSRYGLGHRIWSQSIEHWGYTPEKVEELRVKKIISRPLLRGTIKKFKQRVDEVGKRFPELIGDYNNYLTKPQEFYDRVISVGEELFELKDNLKHIRSHIGGRLGRKGLDYKKWVSNGQEYRVKKILMSLGLNSITQYSIGVYVYDFLIPEYGLIIEYDGQFHTLEKDNIKDKVALEAGFKILRITKQDIKYVRYIKDKIYKTCGAGDSL